MNELPGGGTGAPSGGVVGPGPGAGGRDDVALGVLQRILLTADATVVRILEGFFDEPIRTAGLEQVRRPASPTDADLEPAGHETILHRKVLLQGSITGRNYIYADSLIVLDRLEPSVREGILSTSEPVGRLLVARRIETFKEILRVGRMRAGPLGGRFGMEDSDELLFRTYRISSGGRPIMLITECFPALRFPGQRDRHPEQVLDPDRGPSGDVTETSTCR